MRCRSASLVLGLVALSSAACESTPPPVAPTPPVAAPPVAEALKPAPEPPDLLGVARWKSPGQTVGALAGCAGVPGQLADSVTKPGLELLFHEMFKGAVDAKALADLVALDAPVDAAFALEQGTKNPRGMGAFAIGLKSFDGAKTAFDPSGGLVEIAPGLLKVPHKSRDLTCAVAQAAGPTPARLVCGGREKDLTELGPWLARTAPTMPSASSDLHGELRWVPFDKRFGQEARQSIRGLPLLAQAGAIGDPRFDQALSDAAGALADEITAEANDADHLTLDLGVDPATCVTLGGGIAFRGRTSWLVKEMTDRPERQGPPPAIFWRAPKDSETAIFSRGGDPARYTEIQRTLHALAEGWLSKHGVAAADSKALADLLNVPMTKDVNSVSASGHATAPKLAANAKAQDVLNALMEGYVGWTLIGLDAGGENLAKTFKDMAAAYNRPGVHKAIAGQLRPSSVKNMPVVKVGNGPAALGKGSVDIEIRVNDIDASDTAIGNKAGKGGKPEVLSYAGHIVIMQDGKGAWVAFGSNRDELVKRLVAAKTGAPDAVTLASRPGLEPLKRAQVLGGGFLTLAPFTKAMSAGLSSYAVATGGGLPMLSDAANAINNLPHQGSTPMFVTSKIAGQNQVEISVNLPKGTLEDVGALVLAGVRIANQIKGGGPMMPGP